MLWQAYDFTHSLLFSTEDERQLLYTQVLGCILYPRLLQDARDWNSSDFVPIPSLNGGLKVFPSVLFNLTSV